MAPRQADSGATSYCSASITAMKSETSQAALARPLRRPLADWVERCDLNEAAIVERSNNYRAPD
jgi:hypothetical protein